MYNVEYVLTFFLINKYQGSNSPVGQLKPLLSRDFAIMVKQEREREASARELKDLCSHVSVEQVDHVDGEVALQPGDVAVGPVHDLQDFRIGENLVQTG